MERTQATSLALADRTSAQVGALWDRVGDGLTVPQFQRLAAQVIVQANAQGVALIDLGLTAEVLRQLGRITPPLGLRPTADQIDTERISGRIGELLDQDVKTTDLAASQRLRLEYLAHSEPLLTVAVTMQAAMAAHGAKGWTRALDDKPCPACVSLADGVVRPTGTTMRRHPNCGCMQAPVF